MNFWCATASDKAVKYFVCFVCMDVIGQWTSVSVYLCRTDRLLNRTHTHLSAICLHLFHIVRLLRLCFVVVFIFRLHSCFEPYFLIYSNLVVLLLCSHYQILITNTSKLTHTNTVTGSSFNLVHCVRWVCLCLFLSRRKNTFSHL